MTLSSCSTIHPYLFIPGLHLLANAIAPGAMHDSAERHPLFRYKDSQYCEQIQQTMNWAEAPYVESNVRLITCTRPGCTAIAQILAEQLATKGQLAGSFFFERGKARRDISRYFFLTLAYQIAMNVPGMRELINAAMINDPTLPTKIVDVQLKALIIVPFQELEKSRMHPVPIMTLVVDSLHECETLSVQSNILKLLHRASALVPLRCIICCRRDTELVGIFTRQHCLEHTAHLSCAGGDEQDHDFRPPAPSSASLTEGARLSFRQDLGYTNLGHVSTAYSTSLDFATYPLPQQILSVEDLDSFHEVSTIMFREIQNDQNTIVMEDLTSWFDKETEVTLGDYTRSMSFLCSHS